MRPWAGLLALLAVCACQHPAELRQGQPTGALVLQGYEQCKAQPGLKWCQSHGR